ncbi:hypothetical protein A6C57_27970 (plasmid) [Fibrella sp. ES10-3-2-2]
MKKLLFLGLLLSPLLASIATNASVPPSKEKITFYQVPLVCSADLSIGCGSQAKPALLDMEKNPTVKEAWINRQGTMIAVVWKGEEQTNQVARPIFARYDIDFAAVKQDEQKRQQQTFRQAALWYKGAAVDQLSLKEAVTIVSRYVGFALQQKLITTTEAGKIRPEIEQHFRSELVKIRTLEQLYGDDATAFRQAATRIFTKYTNPARTAKITERYSEYEQARCQERCSIKASCCKKPIQL